MITKAGATRVASGSHVKDLYQPSLRALLAPKAARDLAARGTPQHFAMGETIFAEGEPGSSLFMINTGQVEISKMTYSGRKLVLAYLGAGDLLGEVAVLDESPRSATASAASDVTGQSVALVDFQAFLNDNTDVHLALTRELCAKLRAANERLEDQTEKGGDARLARAVLRLAQKFGKEDGAAIVIPIIFSQADLGDLSGLTRANVNRYLRSWAQAGFVRLEKQRLYVLDVDGLRTLADA